jgi:FtsZ-binding cell division protein ZapB
MNMSFESFENKQKPIPNEWEVVITQEKIEENKEKFEQLREEIFKYNSIIPELAKRSQTFNEEDHAEEHKSYQYDLNSEIRSILSSYSEVLNLSGDVYKVEPGTYDFHAEYAHQGFDGTSFGKDIKSPAFGMEADIETLTLLKKEFQEIEGKLNAEKIREGGFLVNSENIEGVVKNPTPEKLEALREYIKKRRFGFSDLEGVIINSEMEDHEIVGFFQELYKNCKC